MKDNILTLAQVCYRLAGCPEQEPADRWVPRLVGLGIYLPCSGNDPDSNRVRGFWAAARQRMDCLDRVAREIELAARETGTGGWWLKGWASRHLYPQPPMRLMADLDILLEGESEVDGMAEYLIAQGYIQQPQKRPWPSNFERVLLSPDGVVVELHRSLGPERLARRLRVPDPGKGTGLLPPEWQLVHACLHCFQHAGNLKAYQWLDVWLLARDERTLHTSRAILEQAKLRAPMRFFDFLFERNLGEPLAGAGSAGVWPWLYDKDGWRFPFGWRGPKLVVYGEDLIDRWRHR